MPHRAGRDPVWSCSAGACANVGSQRSTSRRAAVFAVLVTSLVLAGCALERTVDLGGDQPALDGRFAVHSQVGGSNPKNCVGAACTPVQAMSGVGPSKASCLEGGGTTCTAKLEVRLLQEEKSAGPALPKGANMAVPAKLLTDVERVLSLRNAAPVDQAAALRVLAVTVEERCGNAPCQGPAGVVCTRGQTNLPCGVAQSTRLVPEASSGTHSHHITLRRLASVPGPREVIVRVMVEGDPSLAKTPWHGVMRQRSGAPRVLVSQSVIAMPWKGPGAPTEAAINLINVGDAQGEIYGFALSGQPGFSYRLAGETQWFTADTLLSKPLEIEPQATVSIQLRFQPDDAAKKHADLVIHSDTTGAPPNVHVIGNGAAPCVLIAPAKEMDLGTLQVGGCSERRLEVRSCGTGMLAIEGLEIQNLTTNQTADSGLSAVLLDGSTANASVGNLVAGVTPTPTSPALIPPGGAQKLRVRYCPTAAQPLDAHILVHANGLPALKLHVKGAAVISLCPVAKIAVQEGLDVLPLTTLHLSGAASYAPIPGALKYQWQVTQPDGSTRHFSPSADAEAPTFVPAVAGPYTFCLTVQDAQGHPSCAKACETVQVVPESNLHVELLWTTPGDPNEADTGAGAGSDVDLHVAHPLAIGPDRDCDGVGDPWFHSTHDAYWANAAPSWGSSAPNAGDDPTVDLDDTDGAGPELISLDQPETAKLGYAVGVHHWNDHGFGSVQARVRVFLGGTLAASFGPISLAPLDFWTVARITFGGNGVANATIKPCWQSSPACAGGKLWQAAGKACVATCYLPALPPAKSHAPSCTTTASAP